jgi:membrane-associated phospholipid phosphatase
VLRAAAACVLTAVLVWAGAFHVGLLHVLDGDVLWAFTRFEGTPVEWLTQPAVRLIQPLAYAMLCAAVVGWALWRGRPAPAAAAAVAMLGANLTTQLLKPALAEQRVHVRLEHQVDAASWPSGHATAAMVLALGAILVAAQRHRPLVGVVAMSAALLASGAVLVEHWHYPSDVLGGYAVAGAWAFGATGALRLATSRLRAPTAAPRRRWHRATG